MEEDYCASNTSALVIFCISYGILGQIPAYPRLLLPCVLWGLGNWVKRLSENILIKTSGSFEMRTQALLSASQLPLNIFHFAPFVYTYLLPICIIFL